MNTCLVVAVGAAGYSEAYELQRHLHAQVVSGALPDLLLLLEHPPVYTLGRRGQRSDILASQEVLDKLGVETHETDRGGETTFHGPGQLVGYPIVNLRLWGGGVRTYVETLEQVLIGTLSEFGITAHSEGKPTGVWVEDRKIAAIGVRVSRSVTMHGFALNVCPDLSFFNHIVPCGMPGVSVTSMSQELGSDVAVSDVMPALARAFASEFGVAVEWSGLDALASAAVVETA